MITRNEIFQHAQEKYGTSPDYPFQKFPTYAALRHASSKKWYALIMNVLPEKVGLEGTEEIDIINLKCPPEISASLRNEDNILPGYHMNKENWISVVLHRTDPEGDMYNLMEQSYDLTK
ncbi:MmcQ/YjbR family DNA-binding protein [Gracilibacillus salinarum]|uniref:MmcQ/YjbR family DNA-binding protein n=1 Tax=Gracilibacillus salinarum TaxID=2932255 RepID=A0ABY4GGQ8_9BACI|nr:MmcQ/YjbR family DNA-binding protein [Gracilibacillus salinarum]UOQ83516.1 MmcQ/YjbR family DNA-binding protein [Gracilibacillus salinarum]